MGQFTARKRTSPTFSLRKWWENGVDYLVLHNPYIYKPCISYKWRYSINLTGANPAIDDSWGPRYRRPDGLGLRWSWKSR